MDVNELKVEKKDGEVEEFQVTKLRGSCMYAGASAEEAEKVTQDMQQWALENHQNGVVKTADMRAKIIELLKQLNPDAASRYESYKKPIDD
jgi:transcriptional regulator NrdR family protein